MVGRVLVTKVHIDHAVEVLLHRNCQSICHDYRWFWMDKLVSLMTSNIFGKKRYLRVAADRESNLSEDKQ